MTSHTNRLTKTVLNKLPLATCLLIVACDPGMAIRQVKAPGQTQTKRSSTDERLIVQVKTSHQLIGETSYAPQVKVTNALDVPITVNRVDLAAS